MIEELTHEEKCCLYVVGRMALLAQMGLVPGGKNLMLPRGIAMFDQLEATGFRPTDWEIRCAVGAFDSKGPEDVEDVLVLLVSVEKERLEGQS